MFAVAAAVRGGVRVRVRVRVGVRVRAGESRTEWFGCGKVGAVVGEGARRAG